MEFRSRYLPSQVLLFLLIMLAGLAVSRLTIEGLWFGSIILIEASVEHPGVSTLILLLLCLLSFLCFFDIRMGYPAHLLADVLVFLVSVTAGILSFQLLLGGSVILFVEPRTYNWGRLVNPFLKHPFLCSFNLLLFCVLCFAVIKTQYRRVMRIGGRVVVLLIIGTAWSFAAEFLWGGVAGFAGEGHRAFLLGVLGFALLLVFLCAAVLKYVFSLQAGNRTLFFANLAGVFVVLFDSLIRAGLLPLGIG